MPKLSPAQVAGLNGMCPNASAAQLGSLLDSSAFGGFGNVYYLDPTNGSDGYNGLSKTSAFKTLPAAYAALTAGQNDVLVYIAGTSSISLSAAFTWAKNYTHFIGASAPVVVANRSRIFQAAAATGLTSLFTISATGCIFSNLMIFQGVADATSLVSVNITGNRCYFENVHFAGIGEATQDTAGAASLQLTGAYECVFRNCAIGLDTVSGGANSTELSVTSNSHRNHFDKCMFYRYISHASHALVTVAAGGIDRWLRFTDCLFYTDSVNRGVSLTSVFSIPAGISQGKILLDANCRMITDGSTGTGDWDSNNRAMIWNAAVAPAAAAAGGIMTKQ